MGTTRCKAPRSLICLATQGAASAAFQKPQAGKLSYADLPPSEVRVTVVGATGYIGRFVVLELVKRGFQVLAVTRPASGIGSKQKVADVEQVGLLLTQTVCHVLARTDGGVHTVLLHDLSLPFHSL